VNNSGHLATDAEHRPRQRTPADSSGRSAHSYGSEGRGFESLRARQFGGPFGRPDRLAHATTRPAVTGTTNIPIDARAKRLKQASSPVITQAAIPAHCRVPRSHSAMPTRTVAASGTPTGNSTGHPLTATNVSEPLAEAELETPGKLEAPPPADWYAGANIAARSSPTLHKAEKPSASAPGRPNRLSGDATASTAVLPPTSLRWPARARRVPDRAANHGLSRLLGRHCGCYYSL